MIYAVEFMSCFGMSSFIAAHPDGVSTSTPSRQHQDPVSTVFLVCLTARQYDRAHGRLAGDRERSD